jgi:hypothetical protein
MLRVCDPEMRPDLNRTSRHRTGCVGKHAGCCTNIDHILHISHVTGAHVLVLTQLAMSMFMSCSATIIISQISISMPNIVTSHRRSLPHQCARTSKQPPAFAC